IAVALFAVTTVAGNAQEKSWPHQPSLVEYLGYDPFTNPALGRPKGNETPSVALLAPSADISQQIMKRRLELKDKRMHDEFLHSDPSAAASGRGWRLLHARVV
ncbi:MAG TPA: hypothetical protein VFT34_07970, partial [Verrucomicrobiae bacterium]|nr:hypothetical protein [Verrucomicrobiae bacterium]